MDNRLETLREALDHVEYGVVLLDQTLTARFINRAFCDMWTFPKEEAQQPVPIERIMQQAYTLAHYEIDDPTADIADRLEHVIAGNDTRLLRLVDGRFIKFTCIPLPQGGRMLTYADETELFNVIEKLKSVVNIDELTQIYNRRYLYSLGEKEVALSRRHGRALSVVMLDIDHFKDINDIYGHAAGDAVIRAVAQRCLETGRSTDSAGRIGGEEFGLVLPETTIEAALQAGERLRKAIAEMHVWAGSDKLHVTISVGAAQWRECDAGFEEVMRRADAALYAAKHGGRNRVCGEEAE
jgi:diguanylate cyclase (GGDEF)-like protein